MAQNGKRYAVTNGAPSLGRLHVPVNEGGQIIPFFTMAVASTATCPYCVEGLEVLGNPPFCGVFGGCKRCTRQGGCFLDAVASTSD